MFFYVDSRASWIPYPRQRPQARVADNNIPTISKPEWWLPVFNQEALLLR